MWSIKNCSPARSVTVKVVAAVILILTTVHLYWYGDWLFDPTARLPLPQRRDLLGRQLSSLFKDHKPKCEALRVINDTPGPYFNAVDEQVRENDIKDVDEIFQPMQESHDGFIHAIQQSNITLPYVRRSTGIVSSAGGVYLPNFLVTLRLIRRRGSKLPVELFM